MTQAPLTREELDALCRMRVDGRLSLYGCSAKDQHFVDTNGLLPKLLAAARIEHEGWRPIETAPKVGRIWAADADSDTALVKWSDTYEVWIDLQSGKKFAATHWLPLPPPPQDGKEEDGPRILHDDVAPSGGGIGGDLPSDPGNLHDQRGPSFHTERVVASSALAPSIAGEEGGGKTIYCDELTEDDRERVTKLRESILQWDAPLAASGGGWDVPCGECGAPAKTPCKQPCDNPRYPPRPSPAPADGLIERLKCEARQLTSMGFTELASSLQEAAAALDGMRRELEGEKQAHMRTCMGLHKATDTLAASQAEVERLNKWLDETTLTLDVQCKDLAAAEKMNAELRAGLEKIARGGTDHEHVLDGLAMRSLARSLLEAKP